MFGMFKTKQESCCLLPHREERKVALEMKQTFSPVPQKKNSVKALKMKNYISLSKYEKENKSKKKSYKKKLFSHFGPDSRSRKFSRFMSLNAAAAAALSFSRRHQLFWRRDKLPNKIHLETSWTLSCRSHVCLCLKLQKMCSLPEADSMLIRRTDDDHSMPVRK